MAILNFPTNPTIGQVYTQDNKSWQWNGVAWALVRGTAPAGKSAYESAIEQGFVGSEASWVESLEGAKGDKGDQGDTGPQGERGEKGDPGDHGTDGADGIDGLDGVGVPAGGGLGQVLTKTSNTNYATAWVTPDFISDYTIPLGGDEGQVLGKTSATDGAFAWVDLPADSEDYELPTGGNEGQVLTKTSPTDFAVAWRTPTMNPLPAGGTTGQVLSKNSGFDGDATWKNPAATGISDAPINGQPYVRKDGAWVIDTEGGISEAPTDDKQYARKNGSWTEVEASSGGSADYPVGGTTGQVLAKASNADNDVEWIELTDGGFPPILQLAKSTEWRIVNLANNGNALWGFTELDVFNVEGVNITPDATVSASSYYASNFLPIYAVDNNIGTRYYSGTSDGTSGATFTLVFTEPMSIKTLRLYNNDGDGRTAMPKDFQLQYKKSDNSWAIAMEVLGETNWAITESRDYEVSAAEIDVIFPSLIGEAGHVLQVNDDEDGFQWTVMETLQGPKGDKGDTGNTGPAGTDGTNGIDGVDGADGNGVPVGGYTGQMLVKVNGEDFNTAWIDPVISGGGSDTEPTVHYPTWGLVSTMINQTFDSSIIPSNFTWVDNMPGTILDDPDAGPSTTKALRFSNGPLGDRAYFWFEFTAIATVENYALTVRYKNQGEDGYDGYLMNVDGVTVFSDRGYSEVYKEHTYNLGVGTHTVRLQYSSDVRYGGGFQNTHFSQIIYPDMQAAVPYQHGDTVEHDGDIWFCVEAGNSDEPGATDSWINLDKTTTVASSTIGPVGPIGDLTFARHWRVYISTSNDPYNSLSNVEFRTEVHVPLNASSLPGTPFSTAIYQAGYDAAKAFDGLDSTTWISNATTPCWVGYSFDEPIGVRQVAIRNDGRSSGANYNQAPRDFQIQYSLDGTAWYQAWAVTNITWGGATPTTKVFESPNANAEIVETYPTTVIALNDVSATAGTLVDGHTLKYDSATATFIPGDPLVKSSLDKHQYWRVLISENQGNSYTGLAELEFADEPGGATLCFGGTPIASGGIASEAFDGEPAGSAASTRWEVNGSSGHWVGYNFGRKVGIYEARIMASSSALPQAPKTFSFQYSDNGAAWVTAWTITNAPVWLGDNSFRTYKNPDAEFGIAVLDAASDGKTYARKDSDWVEAVTNLNNLTDVDTLTTTPTQGQTLFFDQSVNLWKPGTINFPAQNAMGFAWQLETTGTGSLQEISIPYPNLEPWQIMMFSNGSKVRASQYNIVDDKVIYTSTTGADLELLGPAIILDGIYSNRWRLYCTTIDGSTALASIGELYLYTGSQSSPNDIATTGTPTQSSQYSGFGPANFVDRDPSSFSSLNSPPSTYLPGWWQVQFGSSKKIIGFGLSGRISELNNTPKDFQLQYYDATSASWQILINVTNQTGWSSARRDFFL